MNSPFHFLCMRSEAIASGWKKVIIEETHAMVTAAIVMAKKLV